MADHSFIKSYSAYSFCSFGCYHFI